MSEDKQISTSFHMWLSVSLFLLFALGDSLLTLHGMDGNIEMEGNPVMKYLMIQFGLIPALIIGKGGVLLFLIPLALIGVRGIDNQSKWVFWFALTPMSKAYMRNTKRFWVAFIPIYLVSLSQVFAVSSWLYLMLVI